MMKPILLIALAAWAAGSSSDPSGFHFWTQSDLNGLENALAAQMDSHKFKSDTLAKAGNHRFMVVHREATGEAEYHATEDDIVFVTSGSGTLVYGGTMVNARNTAPNEMRADSITSGMEKKVSPGDVITIPAKLPHQMTLEPGKQLNYFVVKVTE
jgi:mannose-6-phosphate isomerase-like protein (cupin superfamily)